MTSAYIVRQGLGSKWDAISMPPMAAMTGSGTETYRLGLMVVDLGGWQALGHQGFWNTFAFHVPSLDLTVAGAIMNHHAENGRQLAAQLVAAVAELADAP